MPNSEEKHKLTYDELKAYTEQTTARAKQIYEENLKLKQIIQETKNQMDFSYINFAFRALDHSDKFSPSFIKKITERLELILTPQDLEVKEEHTIEKPQEGV